MALPIIAKFFQKVYADTELQKRAATLGVSPDLKFEVPPEYEDPCKRDGDEPITPTIQTEEGIDDLFM